MTSVDNPKPEALELEAISAYEAEQAATNAGVARATGVLALGNILSRVLGLAREIVLSNIFGASRALEAFNNALVVSKSLYDLLLAGHVNSAVIPVLSEVVTVKGREELWRLVSVLVSLVTVCVTGLVLVIEIFAPQIVGIIAGSDPRTFALSAFLLRLTAPGLIFMCLFAVLSGTLYALRMFSLPALAGAVFNGSMVIFTLLFIPPLEFAPDVVNGGIVWSIQRPIEGITVVAIAWIVAALAQFGLQMVGLRRAKIRFTFNWRHPAVRRIGALYVPVMVSLLIDTLVIRFFSYNLAARDVIAHGNNYMNWATTLIQFPQGLVATAISIAILPTLSRQAAIINEAQAKNDHDTSSQNQRAFKDTLGLGLRLATTLILPATIGLYVLATPVIMLIFQHGAFTAFDTEITSVALRLYLIGLPFAALDLLLVYAFYARQDTLTPAVIGIFSLVLYMIVALALQPVYGLFSLMIADSVKHISHALISAFLLQRRMEGFGEQRLLVTFIKTLIAALTMGGIAALVVNFLMPQFSHAGFIGEVLIVTAGAGVGTVVFLGLALILRIEELTWLVDLLRKKLRKNP